MKQMPRHIIHPRALAVHHTVPTTEAFSVYTYWLFPILGMLDKAKKPCGSLVTMVSSSMSARPPNVYVLPRHVLRHTPTLPNTLPPSAHCAVLALVPAAHVVQVPWLHAHSCQHARVLHSFHVSLSILVHLRPPPPPWMLHTPRPGALRKRSPRLYSQAARWWAI